MEGIDNCLIKFSRCCTPVPGDSIVGFITRGYGVSVHRADCQNARPSQVKDESGRWVSVSWAVDIKDTYQTSLQVSAKEREGLVVDVASVISNMKIPLRSLNARDLGDGYAVVNIGLEVRDLSQLDAIIGKLARVGGVIEVKRHPMHS